VATLTERQRSYPKSTSYSLMYLGEEKDGIEAAKAILMALRAKATKGDVRAAEVLLDRAYGKAKQVIDATVREASPFKPIDLDVPKDNGTG